MKKFLIIIVIALSSSLAINFIVGPILASYYLNQRAGQNLQVGDYNLKYDKVQVGRLVPPNVSVQKLSLQDPYGFLQVIVPTVLFDMEWQWDSDVSRPKLSAMLSVGGLKVVAYQKKPDDAPLPVPPEANAQEPTSSWEQWLASSFVKVGAGLVVKAASVVYRDTGDQVLYSLDPFDLEISLPDLSQPEKLIKILLKGDARANLSPSFPLNLPIEIDANPLQYGGGIVRSDSINVKLGGFSSTLNGFTDLQKGSHNWKLTMLVKSLLDLPIPPDMLPPGQWFGGLEGTAQVYQEAGKPITVVSDFKTTNLGGDLQLISDTYKINGRVLSEVSWNVRLQDSVLTAKDIKVSVNADALDIKAEPYFKKTSGDKLAVDLEGFVRDETLVVNSKRIQLNQLKLGLSSSVSLKDKMMADIKVDLDRAQLKGLEKMFPPLAKQPMQGEIEFHSELKGPLSEGAESLRLSVNPIVLKNFKSSVNLKDDKNRIYASGPVSANLQGAVKVVKNELDYGTLRGSVDLTKVALNYKAKFKKKSGQRLSASLNLGQNKQSLVTKGSTLNYGPSVLELKGSVRGFVSPSFKLNLKLSNFQTSLVDKTPYWPKDMVANGAVAGNFDLSGKFDQKVGIEKSPIKVKGSVNANFSNFEYMPEPVEVNAEVAAEPTPKLKTVPAFLPTWPVIQDLNLSVDTRVAKFRKNKISGKGLLVKAVVQKGGASVSGKVAEIFAGEVTLKKLLVPLIWENPVIRMSAAVKGLDVPLAFQSLDLQGLPKMTGVATGAVELTTELPESERFLSAMTSSGSLNLANFELKEISLTESMMKNLSKLKKLGVKADTNVKGFKGVANLAYILKNEVMKVSKLDLVSFNKDEFKLKGTLKLAGPVDLKGSVILSKPPFKGEVYECNTDKQGRMTFPVVVKANWMDPDFTVPKQSLDALLSNTLKCQQKKLEKQVKKEADKKLKDVKKKVEGQLQDAVKDLFK